MVVTLEVLNTESNIRRVQITRTAVIGRGKECGLRIASSHISRRHCELLIGKDGVRIRDLSSGNGTFINNKPLVPGVIFELDPDDELRLGSVRMKIEFEPVEVTRPVLKAPTMQQPKGSLMGAIGAAAAAMGIDPDEGAPPPKFDITAEEFTVADEEPSTTDSNVADGADSFEGQETVAAFELDAPSPTSDEVGESIEDDVDRSEIAVVDDDDEFAFSDADNDKDDDEVKSDFQMGTGDDGADEDAILDFLNNLD